MWFFFQSVGIELDDKKRTLKIPKKGELEARLLAYRKKEPDFPNLRCIHVTEILPNADFFKYMLTYDMIFSDPPDLIHDVCFHIIPLLKRIFLYKEGYKTYKEQIFSTFTE